MELLVLSLNLSSLYAYFVDVVINASYLLRNLAQDRQAIVLYTMPRIKLGAIKGRPEVNQPALYLLIDSSGNHLRIVLK